MSEDFAEIKRQAAEKIETLLDRFDYEVVGNESLVEITALAQNDWQADAGYRSARGRDYARPPDDRLAVDFIRHQRTAYDWQLGQVQDALWEMEAASCDDDGENPIESFFDDLKNHAHAVIRTKTLDAIRARHPDLAGAIAHRRSSNYVMSGGQTFRAERPSYFH